VSSEKTLRVAVVGTGRVGRARIREMGFREDAKVVAVASRSLARAREVVASYDAEASGDWRTTIARSDVDAVMICSVNALHAPMAEFALRAGKHVSVDYPLALSRAEAERLIALSAETDRVLHVEHIELLSPWFAACEANLHRVGTIQELSWTNVSARQGSPDDWTFDRASGFSLFAQASLLSRMIRCAGTPEWIAVQETLDGNENGRYRRRETRAELGFAGAVGRIFDAVGMDADGPSGAFSIVGAEGRIVARNLKEATFIAADGVESPLVVAPSGGLFARDIEAFLRAVAHGEKGYVSLTHVGNVMRCADAAERSANEGGKRVAV
jgi:biliverdin reductase